jgi:hypothetical protein
MPDDRNSDQASDRNNDHKLLTPLVLMALIIVGGFAYYAFTGQAPSASG